jgi:hypothetical protein
VEDVADQRDHAQEQRAEQDAAADEQNPGRAGAVVPAPTLSR